MLIRSSSFVMSDMCQNESIIPRRLDTQHSEVFNKTKMNTNFTKNILLQGTTAAPIKSSFCNPCCGEYGSSKNQVRQLMLCLCCLCVFEIAKITCYDWPVSWYYCSEPNCSCFQDLGILIDHSKNSFVKTMSFMLCFSLLAWMQAALQRQGNLSLYCDLFLT